MGANSQNDDASWLLSQLLWRGLVISVNHWYLYWTAWIKVMNAVYFSFLGSIIIISIHFFGGGGGGGGGALSNVLNKLEPWPCV